MQIQIKQNEIEKAIIQFLTEAGINTTDKQIDISFTAGRKNSGLTADVEINDVKFTPAAQVKAEEVKQPEVVESNTEQAKAETNEAQAYSTTAPTTLNGLFGN